MKINKSILIAASALIAFAVSCEKPEKNPPPYDVGIDGVPAGGFLRTLEVTTSEIDFGDIAGSSFGVNLEYNDAENGNSLQDVKVYLTIIDNSPDNGFDSAKAEALYETIAASELQAGNRPVLNYADNTGDAIAFSGLTTDDIGPSDVFQYRFEVNLTSGLSFSAANTNSNIISGPSYQSPFIYNATVVCLPKPPTAGDWTINMRDTYGDGWQTTGPSGGEGMTVTLDGTTVIEFGLCSPYGAAAGSFLGSTDCVPNTGSAGSATVTIPAGTQTAEWCFPGDNWGEIEFDIVTPNGNIVASATAGTEAGPVTIDFCKD